jgi:CheY-like chemotaxis protein
VPESARLQGDWVALKAFVVEDNVAIRDGLVETLAELAGVQTVGTAAAEKPAVQWLQDPAHDWDVAIVDLLLEPGGGTGLGVLRALAGRPASRSVVVLTGTANPDVRDQCLAMGAERVFDKAMETDDLIAWCQERSAGRPG